MPNTLYLGRPLMILNHIFDLRDRPSKFGFRSWVYTCPEFQTAGYGRAPVTVVKQTMVFLLYLGTPESFRSIADRFGISKSTAHSICRRVSKAVLERTARKFQMHLQSSLLYISRSHWSSCWFSHLDKSTAEGREPYIVYINHTGLTYHGAVDLQFRIRPGVLLK